MEKDGILRVWYEQKGEKLFIHVQDNGTGMTRQEQEQLQESFRQSEAQIENGLCNINRRLKMKFGEGYGIEISAEEGKGTFCSLVLPLEREEKGERDVQSVGCG